MSGCGFCESGQTSSGHLSWKGLLSAVLAAFLFTLLAVLPFSKAHAQVQTEIDCVSPEQVEQALQAEEKCLVIVEDYVYDVTQGKRWTLNGHTIGSENFPCGGTFEPEEIDHGPHDASVMDKFKLGPLCGTQAALTAEEPLVGPEETTKSLSQILARFSKEWFGISFFRLTAYLSLGAFVLNFLTCYAMPWARVRQPWEGERPGPDQKDQAGHFPLTHWHKYFAWAAIFFLSLHGFLGFACIWWGQCF